MAKVDGLAGPFERLRMRGRLTLRKGVLFGFSLAGWLIGASAGCAPADDVSAAPSLAASQTAGASGLASIAASGSAQASANVPPAAPAPSAAEPPVAPPAEPARARIGLVGDISLSMAVGAMMDGELKLPTPRPGFPFDAVSAKLASYDMAVGNLECVITMRGRPTIPRPLKASMKSPEALLAAGFDVVSVANNHIQDMDTLGTQETMRALDRAGLPYIGASLIEPSRPSGLIQEVRGIKVGLLGFFNRDAKLALADIAEMKAKADVVIVFIHWGVDNSPSPTRHQLWWGRRMIEAGASAVVGAHSHILQPVELHQGRPIFHSLGNFVFSGMVVPGTRTGAILELDITPNGVLSYQFQKTRIDEYGAPKLEGEPTRDPPIEDPLPLPAMGEPILFR